MTKDKALIELCKALLQDSYVVEQPGWQKLVLIGEVGNGVVGMRGYSYDIQGNLSADCAWYELGSASATS